MFIPDHVSYPISPFHLLHFFCQIPSPQITILTNRIFFEKYMYIVHVR